MQKKLNIWAVMAICYPLGLFPKAPGTVGSLPGLLLGWIAWNIMSEDTPSSPWLAIVLISVVMCFGVYIIYKTEQLWETHDDKSIVIDEVVGQAIVVAFVSPSILNYFLGFILFRIFDIWKPGPIRWVDKRWSGPWGTMIDDIMAGIVAGFILIGFQFY